MTTRPGSHVRSFTFPPFAWTSPLAACKDLLGIRGTLSSGLRGVCDTGTLVDRIGTGSLSGLVSIK